MFFFLVQTEQGDIFKVTLETDDDMVSFGKCPQVQFHAVECDNQCSGPLLQQDCFLVFVDSFHSYRYGWHPPPPPPIISFDFQLASCSISKYSTFEFSTF